MYDPATGVWSPAGALATTRAFYTATLLPSGTVLVTGGSDPSNVVLSSIEVYEDTEVRHEWRPVITPPTDQHPGETFRIIGSRLRGLSEASSGNTQNSATNLPVLSLLALEGGKLTRVKALDSFSETEVSGRTPIVPNGYYILSVMANGIHGGQMVLVNGPPPAVPAITSPDEFVNLQRPVIAGTAEPGSTVVVRLNGSVEGKTQADAQGQWSFTPASALAEGLHRAVAIAVDSVGDISPGSEERSFTVDTVPSGAPVLTAPGDFVSTQKPTIAGTAEPGSKVTVWLDHDETKIGIVEVDASGAWSFTPDTALHEGLDHTVSAFAEDAAGNRSERSHRQFSIQMSHYGWNCTTAPAVSATWALLLLALSLGRARKGR